MQNKKPTSITVMQRNLSAEENQYSHKQWSLQNKTPFISVSTGTTRNEVKESNAQYRRVNDNQKNWHNSEDSSQCILLTMDNKQIEPETVAKHLEKMVDHVQDELNKHGDCAKLKQDGCAAVFAGALIVPYLDNKKRKIRIYTPSLGDSTVYLTHIHDSNTQSQCYPISEEHRLPGDRNPSRAFAIGRQDKPTIGYKEISLEEGEQYVLTVETDGTEYITTEQRALLLQHGAQNNNVLSVAEGLYQSAGKIDDMAVILVDLNAIPDNLFQNQKALWVNVADGTNKHHNTQYPELWTTVPEFVTQKTGEYLTEKLSNTPSTQNLTEYREESHINQNAGKEEIVIKEIKLENYKENIQPTNTVTNICQPLKPDFIQEKEFVYFVWESNKTTFEKNNIKNLNTLEDRTTWAIDMAQGERQHFTVGTKTTQVNAEFPKQVKRAFSEQLKNKTIQWSLEEPNNQQNVSYVKIAVTEDNKKHLSTLLTQKTTLTEPSYPLQFKKLNENSFKNYAPDNMADGEIHCISSPANEYKFVYFEDNTIKKMVLSSAEQENKSLIEALGKIKNDCTISITKNQNPVIFKTIQEILQNNDPHYRKETINHVDTRRITHPEIVHSVQNNIQSIYLKDKFKIENNSYTPLIPKIEDKKQEPTKMEDKKLPYKDENLFIKRQIEDNFLKNFEENNFASSKGNIIPTLIEHFNEFIKSCENNAQKYSNNKDLLKERVTQNQTSILKAFKETLKTFIDKIVENDTLKSEIKIQYILQVVYFQRIALTVSRTKKSSINSFSSHSTFSAQEEIPLENPQPYSVEKSLATFLAPEKKNNQNHGFSSVASFSGSESENIDQNIAWGQNIKFIELFGGEQNKNKTCVLFEQTVKTLSSYDAAQILIDFLYQIKTASDFDKNKDTIVSLLKQLTESDFLKLLKSPNLYALFENQLSNNCKYILKLINDNKLFNELIIKGFKKLKEKNKLKSYFLSNPLLGKEFYDFLEKNTESQNNIIQFINEDLTLKLPFYAFLRAKKIDTDSDRNIVQQIDIKNCQYDTLYTNENENQPGISEWIKNLPLFFMEVNSHNGKIEFMQGDNICKIDYFDEKIYNEITVAKIYDEKNKLHKNIDGDSAKKYYALRHGQLQLHDKVLQEFHNVLQQKNETDINQDSLTTLLTKMSLMTLKSMQKLDENNEITGSSLLSLVKTDTFLKLIASLDKGDPKRSYLLEQYSRCIQNSTTWQTEFKDFLNKTLISQNPRMDACLDLMTKIIKLDNNQTIPSLLKTIFQENTQEHQKNAYKFIVHGGEISKTIYDEIKSNLEDEKKQDLLKALYAKSKKNELDKSQKEIFNDLKNNINPTIEYFKKILEIEEEIKIEENKIVSNSESEGKLPYIKKNNQNTDVDYYDFNNRNNLKKEHCLRLSTDFNPYNNSFKNCYVLYDFNKENKVPVIYRYDSDGKYIKIPIMAENFTQKLNKINIAKNDTEILLSSEQIMSLLDPKKIDTADKIKPIKNIEILEAYLFGNQDEQEKFKNHHSIFDVFYYLIHLPDDSANNNLTRYFAGYTDYTFSSNKPEKNPKNNTFYVSNTRKGVQYKITNTKGKLETHTIPNFRIQDFGNLTSEEKKEIYDHAQKQGIVSNAFNNIMDALLLKIHKNEGEKKLENIKQLNQLVSQYPRNKALMDWIFNQEKLYPYISQESCVQLLREFPQQYAPQVHAIMKNNQWGIHDLYPAFQEKELHSISYNPQDIMHVLQLFVNENNLQENNEQYKNAIHALFSLPNNECQYIYKHYFKLESTFAILGDFFRKLSQVNLFDNNRSIESLFFDKKIHDENVILEKKYLPTYAAEKFILNYFNMYKNETINLLQEDKFENGVYLLLLERNLNKKEFNKIALANSGFKDKISALLKHNSIPTSDSLDYACEYNIVRFIQNEIVSQNIDANLIVEIFKNKKPIPDEFALSLLKLNKLSVQQLTDIVIENPDINPKTAQWIINRLDEKAILHILCGICAKANTEKTYADKHKIKEVDLYQSEKKITLIPATPLVRAMAQKINEDHLHYYLKNQNEDIKDSVRATVLHAKNNIATDILEADAKKITRKKNNIHYPPIAINVLFTLLVVPMIITAIIINARKWYWNHREKKNVSLKNKLAELHAYQSDSNRFSPIDSSINDSYNVAKVFFQKTQDSGQNKDRQRKIKTKDQKNFSSLASKERRDMKIKAFTEITGVPLTRCVFVDKNSQSINTIEHNSLSKIDKNIYKKQITQVRKKLTKHKEAEVKRKTLFQKKQEKNKIDPIEKIENNNN